MAQYTPRSTPLGQSPSSAYSTPHTRTSSSSRYTSSSGSSRVLSTPAEDVETHIRCGRRPPMSADGKTAWYPGSRRDENHEDEEEMFGLETKFATLEMNDRRLRQRKMEQHAADTLYKMDLEEEAEEAAQALQAGSPTLLAAFQTPPGPPARRRRTHSDPVKPGSISSRRPSTPIRKHARFATDDGLVELLMYEPQSDEEESLADYFGTWTKEEKEAILAKPADPSPPPSPLPLPAPPKAIYPLSFTHPAPGALFKRRTIALGCYPMEATDVRGSASSATACEQPSPCRYSIPSAAVDRIMLHSTSPALAVLLDSDDSEGDRRATELQKTSAASAKRRTGSGGTLDGEEDTSEGMY